MHIGIEYSHQFFYLKYIIIIILQRAFRHNEKGNTKKKREKRTNPTH